MSYIAKEEFCHDQETRRIFQCLFACVRYHSRSCRTVLLILLAAHSTPHLLVVLVYGLSVIFMFSASPLHHAFKVNETDHNLWHRLDRLAIYFMIAGTYTPVFFLYLNGSWRWSIIGIQWGLVVFGFASQIFFPGASRVLLDYLFGDGVVGGFSPASTA